VSLPPVPAQAPRVVAFGGGHGLAASLSALRRVTDDVTAIVTVADNGGSSGRLRTEFGALPPGDLRMALAALCGDDEWGTTWARVVQHRFGGDGDLAGHSLGNLLIAGLWDLLGDPVAGLDWVGRLLRVTGRVLPMAAVPMDIVACVEGLDPAAPAALSTVRGQAAVAVTPGRVRSISLVPADPPAVPEAVTAVLEADWVVFGPGSWFTSVLPHLLVPSLQSALSATSARKLVALNLMAQPGETEGFSPHRHLEVLADHAPSLSFDVVLADAAAVAGAEEELRKAAEVLRASLALADVAAPDGTRHDPVRLAAAFRRVFRAGSLQVGGGGHHETTARSSRPGPDATAFLAIGPGVGGTSGVQGVVPPGEDRAVAMAMTGVVKDELSRVPVVKPCCRKTEVSTLLRFAGGLTLTAGHIVIEAELDTAVVARRLRASIAEVFGQPSELLVLAPGGLRKGNRYVVRVAKGGDSLARQTGLIDSFGRPVRGLPRQVVSGGICDCEAAWRGAFLVHGSLTEPGRSMALEVTCPGSEAALALVGAARRLKISAKAREVRGVDRVVIRDGEAIAAMLTRLGAHDSVLAWEERRMRREVRATANRLANFDDANLRRSARAAVAAGARVERALEILDTDAPEHLVMAGRLRVANRQASLEELGQLADPPLTKDAIAGRIRRLLAMADRRAADLGMPSTEACLTADMLP
jgi:DNA-binding protein WhiA